MKRICRKLALLASAAALLVSLAAPVSAAVYLDVESGDWFTPAVSYVVRKGLFVSVQPGYFGPEQAMNRGMFYVVLSRMAGVKSNDAVNTSLVDVPADKWFTGSVVWAMSTGIAQPVRDGFFGVTTPVTRAEICLALDRLDSHLKLERLDDTTGLTFSDLGGLDSETVKAVAACQTAGIVSGRSGGLFAPHQGASRAEVAQMLLHFGALLGAGAPTDTRNTVQTWDTCTGWSGQLAVDFPLANPEMQTPERIRWLNKRILNENFYTRIAAQGVTLDGNPKHVTNAGELGLSDCINVTTTFWNRNNDVDEGVRLTGQQEYYGYSLQVDGVSKQDRWHSAAEKSQKAPWQCTWWVWGRAAQYLEMAYNLNFKDFCGGKDNFGHGASYFRNMSFYFLSNQTPSANSIASWRGGSYGHVAYVEGVDDGGIWVSMSDSGHSWRGITYIAKSDSANNPYPLYWYPGETFNGFNHLDFNAAGIPMK